MPKKNEILLPQDFFTRLRNKHLLLDSSFFGDYSAYPEMFHGFVNECKANDITFVTIMPVVAEFTRGSDTQAIFTAKTSLINEIIDYLLPVHPNVFGVEVPWLVEKYGQSGKKMSTTDFALAATTKIHKTDLVLVTKNPQDFPTTVFTVDCYFLLRLERALQVYGIYCYKDQETIIDANEPPF